MSHFRSLRTPALAAAMLALSLSARAELAAKIGRASCRERVF